MTRPGSRPHQADTMTFGAASAALPQNPSGSAMEGRYASSYRCDMETPFECQPLRCSGDGDTARSEITISCATDHAGSRLASLPPHSKIVSLVSRACFFGFLPDLDPVALLEEDGANDEGHQGHRHHPIQPGEDVVGLLDQQAGDQGQSAAEPPVPDVVRERE